MALIIAIAREERTSGYAVYGDHIEKGSRCFKR